MQYYAVLSAATLLLVALSLGLYRRTHSPAFPVGALFLYYESLYGGWYITYDKLGGESGAGYSYLEEKMFPIRLDADYLAALLIYSLFLVVVLIAAGSFVRPAVPDEEHAAAPIFVSHLRVMALCIAAATGSYLLVREEILAAASMQVSPYNYIRRGGGEVPMLFSIHQLLFRLAVVPAVIALAATLSGEAPRLIVAKRSWVAVARYLLLLTGIGGLAFMLGYKSEILNGAIIGGLFYAANARRPRWGSLGFTTVTILFVMTLTDALRAAPIAGLADALSATTFTDRLKFVTMSTEAFAGHFSMYGVLAYDLPISFGQSLVSLVASTIPRAVWPDRPHDIYAYYAAGVHAVEGQGYTINHATAWYLNFGLIGVLAGGILLGAVWAKCFNAYYGVHRGQSRVARVAGAVVPWTVTAYLLNFIRTGPEGYKGLLFEAVLLPLAAFLLVGKEEGLNRDEQPPIVSPGPSGDQPGRGPDRS